MDWRLRECPRKLSYEQKEKLINFTKNAQKEETNVSKSQTIEVSSSFLPTIPESSGSSIQKNIN